MRIAYMGTPQFAATILEYLAAQHDVVAVFTRPDAVRGRGNKVDQSPVKATALGLGLTVHETSRFTEQEVALLSELQPDFICVAAFGVLLPESVLAVPKHCCLNVHGSLLPRWRGAAPIARSILAGDHETGVCIMRMEKGLDTGDYCVCRSVELGDMDAQELECELADLGAQALLAGLEHVAAGVPEWVAQDESCATYASKIEKGELDVSPAMEAAHALRCIRASDASHPSRALLAGKRVRWGKMASVQPDGLGDASGPVAQAVANLAPGRACFVGKRLFVGFADGALEVLSVQPDGKSMMDAKAFAAGVQNIKRDGADWSAL